MTFLGLVGTLSTSAAVSCRHRRFLSHTHKEGGGEGGIPSSSSTRSLEGRRKDGPYMYTLSAVYTWWPVRKQDFFTLCDDQQISLYCARVPFHSRLSIWIYKDSHQTFYCMQPMSRLFSAETHNFLIHLLRHTRKQHWPVSIQFSMQNIREP